MSKLPELLSLRVCDILDKIGVSENIRKLHRHAAVNNDILSTLEYDLRSLDFTSHTFGSYCEGTTTYGMQSDIDYLLSVDTNFVVEDPGDAPGLGRAMLIIREQGTYPGYVKLQGMQYGIPMLAAFGILNFDAYDTNDTGNVYTKHLPEAIMGYSERNGPADTYRFESGVSFDRVVAMESDFIPQFARSFLTMHRPHNWPTKEDIDTMGRLGCFYVGVGHPNSPEHQTEWRLSLSRQERMLMFSLNETQHKCYVLLKMIKKDIIEAEIGKSISSYHCKTCVFHVIENTPAALWRPEKVCQCVILCLMTLHGWVYHGYCPNFFIREENMFDRKAIQINKTRLLRIIRSLIVDRYRFFYTLKTDRVGELLAQRGTYLDPSCRLYTSHYICNMFQMMVSDVIHTDPRKYKVNSHGLKSGVDHPAVIDVTILGMVTNMLCLRDHSEFETRRTLSYLQSLLHLNMAQSLISLWFSANSRQTSIDLIKAFDYHFRKAESHSTITTKLILATVLYRIGKQEECRKLLEQLEMDFKSKVAPICSCQAKVFKSNVFIWERLNPESMSFRLFQQCATAPCVQFVRSDLEIIPTALRYEMFRSSNIPETSRQRNIDYWYDLAVVDARVYLHFLQYLVYSKLGVPAQKQAALNKLRGTTLSKENLGHRETACNLLGWIYIQEGHFAEAVEWFVASWTIRPVHNAAKWHVRQLMARILRGRLLSAMHR